jgi:hypothetical protein
VIASLVLASTLLAASRGGCYLVGNKRIEIIPCNFDPTVIADRLAKMEGQPPADAGRAAAPDANEKQARVQARASPDIEERARRPRRDAPQSAPSPPAPSSGQQSTAQPGAAQTPVPGQGGAPQAASQTVDAQRADARPAVDAAAAELRGLEPALASGSAPDAQGVLARAAQAFAAANDSRGAAAVAKAQEALARGDFFAARQAIAAAIGAAAQR